MIYVRRAPPEDLPVSLAELKAHLRREAEDVFEDGLLAGYLAAAIDNLDGRYGLLGRCLVAQEWSALAERPERLPCGQLGFRVGLGPFRHDLPVSLRRLVGGDFFDVDAALYRVERERCDEASFVLAPGASWPPADPVRNAWRVDFTAGTAPGDVPAALRAAILLLAADLDGDRSGKSLASLVPNPTVERLVAPYRRVVL